MKPRIVQITSQVVHANDGEWVVLYGLAEDGSVWLASNPNTHQPDKWELVVASLTASEGTSDA